MPDTKKELLEQLLIESESIAEKIILLATNESMGPGVALAGILMALDSYVKQEPKLAQSIENLLLKGLFDEKLNKLDELLRKATINRINSKN